MSNKIRLAIVGCGIMGNRHLSGLLELNRVGLCNFDLIAVCDPVIENASALAKRAEEKLGTKIFVTSNLEELEIHDVQAIDITTVPWVHHTIAVSAMERGWHVMVEKPMGLTVKACKIMLDTAEKTQCILSVAENFHYDPMNRLGKELIENEVIGTPRFIIQNSIGGGNSIIVTPWRHFKRGGGPILDVGVHYTYITEYLMGEVDSVYAQSRLHEKNRKSDNAEIYVDAEDAVYATLLFNSGAVGQYIEDHAGHGQSIWQRLIFGSKGSITMPGDRSGKPIVVMFDNKEPINDERILNFVPDFSLDKITATLFGGERIWKYDMPFTDIDSKLLAIEYANFSQLIEVGWSPGVDPIKAMRSVALSYAMLESSQINQPVTMEEIINEEITIYQDEINGMIGLY